jgi:cysteine-rich repeat protein
MNSWRNMWIVMCVAAFWLSGCMRDRLSPDDGARGRVEFQLRGSGVSGDEYRLRDAVMTVQGPFNTLFFDSEDDPNRTAWTAEVPVGSYQAHLQEDWRLERLVDEQPEPVLAELLTENPYDFEVLEEQLTRVVLRFRLLDGETTEGDFEIVLEVLDGDLPPGVCETATDCGAEEKCCDAGLLGSCTPSANPCPLPDLSVSEEATSDSLELEEHLFEAGDCPVMDGCVGGAGTRRLLRFDTLVPNTGDGDLILGTPEAGTFQWSECHEQYYVEDFMSFELLDVGGATVANGSRKASCVVDSSVYVDAAGTPESARFHCGFQGIQRGWADSRSADLECQWVDVTDVEPGDYTLRITVNPDESLPESSYDNNVVEVAVVVTGEEVTDPLAPCETAAVGLERECGWEVAAGFLGASCEAGETISVTCGCVETPPCSGDPMLRVCPDDEACEFGSAIGSSEDACGECPLASFTCPAGGSYTVLVGAYEYGQAYTCQAQVVESEEPICGNNVVDDGEACDGTDTVPGAECNEPGTPRECLYVECGDSVEEGTEECDDGNTLADDGCGPTCLEEFCGDGVENGSEQCDDGNEVEGDGCSSTCMAEGCGDGTPAEGEECDDGNNVDGDGCSRLCLEEYCGDEIVNDDGAEECDPPGSVEQGLTCEEDCTWSEAPSCEECTALSCASQLAACADPANDGATGPSTTGNRCEAVYECISNPMANGHYCMTFDGDTSPLSCSCPVGMNALDCGNGDPAYPPFAGNADLECLPIMRRAANATGQPPASMGTLMFNFVDTAFAVGDALNIVACQLPNCTASCAHIQVP